MYMLEDLRKAEARFNSAAAELRSYESDPREWHGHQSVDHDGRKRINLAESHFDHLDALRRKVERARTDLLSVRAAWLAGE